MVACTAAGALVVSLAVAPAALAAAGTVALDSVGPFAYASFNAAPGTNNNLTVTTAKGSVTFSDPAGIDIVVVDPGCAAPDANTVTCVATGLVVDVRLGDLADTAVHNGSLGLYPGGGLEGSAGYSAFGEAGADALTGSDTDSGERLVGGAGNDQLNLRNHVYLADPERPLNSSPTGGSADGEAGNDVITAGNGDDFLEGGLGADQLNGGDGDDYLSGDPAGFGIPASTDPNNMPGLDTIQGGNGFDRLSASSFTRFSVMPPTTPEGLVVDLIAGSSVRLGGETDVVGGIEDVDTDDGPDQLTGTAGPNALSSGAGDDQVNPGAGPDAVELDRGNDSADLVDGFGDRVNCGPGADSVRIDQFDAPTQCESVVVVATRPAGADIVAPVCTLAKGPKKRTKRKKFFSGGLSGQLTCSEPAAVSARIVVSLKRVRRNRLVTSRVADLVLGESSLPRAGGVRTLKVKPSKKLARRLARRFTARLVIEARDEFGNSSVLSRKTKVR